MYSHNSGFRAPVVSNENFANRPNRSSKPKLPFPQGYVPFERGRLIGRYSTACAFNLADISPK